MAVIKPKSQKIETGRKFNPDTADKIKLIIESVSKGIPVSIACPARGLSEAHFYNFIKQGLVDLEAKEATIHAKLVESFKLKQENFVNGCLSDIRNSDKGHRGAEWTLERSYWKYFSSNVPAIEIQKELDELKKLLAEKDKAKGE
jgi:hypothetical protein